jgi:hypothetical protein
MACWAPSPADGAQAQRRIRWFGRWSSTRSARMKKRSRSPSTWTSQQAPAWWRPEGYLLPGHAEHPVGGHPAADPVVAAAIVLAQYLCRAVSATFRCGVLALASSELLRSSAPRQCRQSPSGVGVPWAGPLAAGGPLAVGMETPRWRRTGGPRVLVPAGRCCQWRS